MKEMNLEDRQYLADLIGSGPTGGTGRATARPGGPRVDRRTFVRSAGAAKKLGVRALRKQAKFGNRFARKELSRRKRAGLIR